MMGAPTKMTRSSKDAWESQGEELMGMHRDTGRGQAKIWYKENKENDQRDEIPEGGT